MKISLFPSLLKSATAGELLPGISKSVKNTGNPFTNKSEERSKVIRSPAFEMLVILIPVKAPELLLLSGLVLLVNATAESRFSGTKFGFWKYQAGFFA